MGYWQLKRDTNLEGLDIEIIKDGYECAVEAEVAAVVAKAAAVAVYHAVLFLLSMRKKGLWAMQQNHVFSFFHTCDS